MLWYIIFVVVVHIFRCYSTCFSMLHYIVLRCCSIYIKILHYIIFSYVCDIVLEVFRALWDRGGGGMGARWGIETRARWGTEDTGAMDAIPFHYVPIRFCGWRAVWEGERRPDTLLAPVVRALGCLI